MKTLKMRLVTLLMAIVTLFSVAPINAFAASSNSNFSRAVRIEPQNRTLTITYTSGWGQAWEPHYLYSDPQGDSQYLGEVLPAGVGFTIIAETEVSLLIDTYNFHNKWISRNQATIDMATCKAGDVVITSSVYAGAGTNTGELVGTIYANDIVTILAKSGNYYFIEFNDSSYLRKRGWVNKNNVLRYGSSEVSDLDVLLGNNTHYASSLTHVYYAPGSGYTYYTNLSNNYQYVVIQYTTIHGHDYALISFIVHYLDGGMIGGTTIDKLALGYIDVDDIT